jgi:hypothetical protein
MAKITALDRSRVGDVRRGREINWGDRTKIVGAERPTLAWVSVEESLAVTLYVAAIVRGDARFACVVDVQWGHGGASVAQTFEVVHRLVVPLAASMVSVSGRLLDPDGKPAPASVSADVSVIVAPGVDAHALHNTRWLSSVGTAGALTTTPTRLMRAEALNVGGTSVWLMLFDGAPNVGDAPTIVRRAPVNRTVTIRRPDSHAFRRGLHYGASSEPLAYAPVAASRAFRIDAEILT